MTFVFSKSKNSNKSGEYDSSKNYDCLLILTGETSFWDRSFPVSKEAIRLFESGKFGCIFVTGGYGGFAKGGPGVEISEAEDTKGYLLERGIKEGKIYTDGRSLESVGNFTFPLVKPIFNNPGFDEFRSMCVVAKKGHKWRVEDYANRVLPYKADFQSIPGRHNNGIVALLYHVSLMNALKGKDNAKEIHEFLMDEHPFYSENWFKSPIFERQMVMGATILKWSWKGALGIKL